MHPEDDDIVIVGAIGSSAGGGNALQKYDHRSKQIQLITTWPEVNRGRGVKDWKQRFQWTYPIRFSRHDPNLLYIAGNKVMRSDNLGQSWDTISPDLTRADVATMQPPGGPIHKDTTGAENYATIFSFEESPHEQGVFWAGSDDGLVHISRDGGKTWTDVTPKKLPFRTQVHTIEPSPHDPATAYLAGTRYKLDDYSPYVFKTTDYGATWTKIIRGLPENDFTRVVREDPAQQGTLYLGTETGLYVSFDDGGLWQRMGGNFPVVPVYDLQRKGADLVVATHGRSFWILDDVTTLHQMTAESDGAPQLLQPAPYVRMPEPMFGRWATNEAGKVYMISLGATATVSFKKDEQGVLQSTHWDCGADAPMGVTLHYVLAAAPEHGATLTIMTADGTEIRTFSSVEDAADKSAPRISTSAGLNSFGWDMRYPAPTLLTGSEAPLYGPAAAPGTYQARLDVDGQSSTTTFEILADPRTPASAEDLQAQFDLLHAINTKHDEVNTAANRVHALREQIATWQARAAKDSDVAKACKSVDGKLTAVENVLVQRNGGNFFDMDHPARLSAQLANLPSVVGSADSAPTQQSHEVFAGYAAEADAAIAQLEAVLGDDLAALNDLIRSAELPAISA